MFLQMYTLLYYI